MEKLDLCTKLSSLVKNASAKNLTQVCSLLQRLREECDRSTKKPQSDVSNTVDDVILLCLLSLLPAFQKFHHSLFQELAFSVLLRLMKNNSSSTLTNGRRFFSVLQCCALYLPGPETDLNMYRKHSEEPRLIILECIQLLLTKSSDIVLNQYLAPVETSFLAYLVASLLQVVRLDQSQVARQMAIQNTMSILEMVDDPDVVAQFLPGVCTSMLNCIQVSNQSSKTAVAATRCISKAILLSLRDDSFTTFLLQKSGCSIEELRNSSSQARAIDPESKFNRDAQSVNSYPTSPQASVVRATWGRDQTWLNETKKKVDLVLSQIFSIVVARRKYISWRMRLAVVELCSNVLLHCRTSLEQSLMCCFEQLLVSVEDPLSEVSMVAFAKLSDALTSFSSHEWLDYLPTCMERFNLHLSRLASGCGTEHETGVDHLVQILSGYLWLLGGRMTFFVDSSIRQILTGLVKVFALDFIDIQLVTNEKYSLHSDAGVKKTISIGHFNMRLVHIKGEKLLSGALSFIRLLGRVATPSVVVDCVFELLQDNSMRASQPELLFLLNEFLRGWCSSTSTFDDKLKEHARKNGITSLIFQTDQNESTPLDDCFDSHLIGRVVEELVHLQSWEGYLVSSHELRPGYHGDFKQKDSRTSLTIAFALECIGSSAQLLGTMPAADNELVDGAQGFTPYLPETLYPLLEKLGSEEPSIQRAAVTSLQKIFFFCRYESVDHLLNANMDYLVDALCSRLQNLEMHPTTPSVLDGLLRISQISSISVLKEVVDALLTSLDMYQRSQYSRGLLGAIQLLVRSMISRKISNENANGSCEDNPSLSSPVSLMSLTSFVKEMRSLTSGISFELSDQEEGYQETSNELKHAHGAIPVDFDDENGTRGESVEMLVASILRRCAHFLADLDLVTRCLGLKIFREGFRYLRLSKENFLPLVHDVWPSIIYLFQVEDHVTRIAVVSFIGLLAEFCGEFIGDRFVESVWPHLNEILIQKSKHRPWDEKFFSCRMLPFYQDRHHELNHEFREGKSEVKQPKYSRKTQEERLIVAVFRCLRKVVQHTTSVAPLVHDMSATSIFFLDNCYDAEIQEAARGLILELAVLNGDEVFFSLATSTKWTLSSQISCLSSRFLRLPDDRLHAFYRKQHQSRSCSFLQLQNAKSIVEGLSKW